MKDLHKQLLIISEKLLEEAREMKDYVIVIQQFVIER